jgi:hypothetical protein
MSPDEPNADKVDLGPCCACEGIRDVRNVVMLDKKAPLPGRGWGCVVCGLPLDGAVAVLCDDCLENGREPQMACRGYPAEDGRVPIGELTGSHEHDEALHRPLESARLAKAELRASYHGGNGHRPGRTAIKAWPGRRKSG